MPGSISRTTSVSPRCCSRPRRSSGEAREWGVMRPGWTRAVERRGEQRALARAVTGRGGHRPRSPRSSVGSALPTSASS
jgi:hypothetical protein